MAMDCRGYRTFSLVYISVPDKDREDLARCQVTGESKWGVDLEMRRRVAVRNGWVGAHMYIVLLSSWVMMIGLARTTPLIFA